LPFVNLNINFTAVDKKPAGAIFIILDAGSEKLKELLVGVTNTEGAFLPDVKLGWREFKKRIYDFQKEYLQNSNLILVLRKEIENRLSNPEGVTEILNFLKKNQLEELKIYFKYLIKEKIASDLEINLNSEIWEGIKDEKKEDEKIQKKEIYLNIQIGCDNKKGKSVRELKKGEKILVKILPANSSEEYLSFLLKGKIGEENFPVVAEAEKIKELDNENFLFIVKFGPGIFGRTVVKNDIKVVTLEKDKVEPLDSNVVVSLPSFPKYFFAEIILLLLLFGIYFLYKILESGY
jgi:hypothetical protein